MNSIQIKNDITLRLVEKNACTDWTGFYVKLALEYFEKAL